MRVPSQRGFSRPGGASSLAGSAVGSSGNSLGLGRRPALLQALCRNQRGVSRMSSCRTPLFQGGLRWRRSSRSSSLPRKASRAFRTPASGRRTFKAAAKKLGGVQGDGHLLDPGGRSTACWPSRPPDAGDRRAALMVRLASEGNVQTQTVLLHTAAEMEKVLGGGRQVTTGGAGPPSSAASSGLTIRAAGVGKYPRRSRIWNWKPQLCVSLADPLPPPVPVTGWPNTMSRASNQRASEQRSTPARADPASSAYNALSTEWLPEQARCTYGILSYPSYPDCGERANSSS